jgi:hypothetical protein
MSNERASFDSNAPELTTAHGETFAFRQRLVKLYDSAPMPKDELLFNLGLYVRSSLLVKFLVMNDLYARIANVPGALLEFGVWWGQNLVLLENLRAIHEPFNKQRSIIGFDTFDGYRTPDDADAAAKEFYRTPAGYKSYLSELLEVHEGNNAFGHNRGNHRLIEGDVTVTAPRYFEEHPETIVALAYFDMGPYEPTIAALNTIKPHLIPGSVILFDELTWAGAPGEAIAFKEAFRDVKFSIEKCRWYPSKNIVTVTG